MLILSTQTWAAQKVALVKVLRGKVQVIKPAPARDLKVDDWLEEGMLVKTAEKSFVKLIFVDKSQMNVGPESEMLIEKFSGKDSGIIDLVKGKVRSQVTKDYLQIEDKDKSKLFIKTKNAVMGVRGTDFMVTTNGINTATVLFEGEVVFNHSTNHRNLSSTKLDDIADRGVRIMPGEFSVVSNDRPQPTVPAVLNLAQKWTLEKNREFESNERNPSSVPKEETRSIVPEGLSGQDVANTSDSLKTVVSEVASVAPDKVAPAPNKAPALAANGFVSGDTVKPANGSFLHLDSGVVIAPPADSVFDPNTNSFIPSSANGSLSADGDYVPPQNMTIAPDGTMVVNVALPNGEVKAVKIVPPPPVTTTTSTSLSSAVTIIKENPQIMLNTATPIVLDKTAAFGSTTPIPTALNPTFRQTTTGGIDQTTSVLQRTNGRLSINVIK